MGKLFISYRRADSSQATGRIYDKLVSTYGQENIFKDVDSIPLGTDFRRVIEESLNQSDAILVVLGPSWLAIDKDKGTRRIDEPHDYVRIEIELALRRKILVLPLLIDDAVMPKEQELPSSLRTFAYFNARRVRSDPDFHPDMERVIKAIGGQDRIGETIASGKAPKSNVMLIDASLDPNDSPYEETNHEGRKTIRRKRTIQGDHDALNYYGWLSLAQVEANSEDQQKYFRKGLTLVQDSGALTKRELTTRALALAWGVIAAHAIGDAGTEGQCWGQIEGMTLDVRPVGGRFPVFFDPLSKCLGSFDQLRTTIRQQTGRS